MITQDDGEQIDDGVDQVLLGLDILAATSPPGKSHTCEEIAAYCGVTHAYINAVEHRAIAKLRKAFNKVGVRSLER